MSETTNFIEPLLRPDNSRYVMFPIKDNEIWKMYKKQVDCFWVAQEVDTSKDISDWDKLSKDEKHFISMILAFFSSSDGIVLENLASRFMNDVQLAEARAFYGFQIAMENIHCVTGDTQILTDHGYYKIIDLKDKKVNIWNGEEFTPVEVKYTGNQPIYRVTLSNGMHLDCTSGHKWLINIENKIEKIETDILMTGDVLQDYSVPFINNTENYTNRFINPYLHGFFCSKGEIIDNKYLIKLKNTHSNSNYISKLINKVKTYEYIDNTYIFDITSYINKPQFYVPNNNSLETKINWLDGLIETIQSKINNSIVIYNINIDFLKNIQLLLTTLSIKTTVNLDKKTLIINDSNLSKLKVIGCNFSFNIPEEKCNCEDEIELEFDNTEDDIIKIQSIEKISDDEPTYCFNEPKKHTGIFNGILTGQSEMYSILIDTYIKDGDTRDKLFNAIDSYPCIAKKAHWAKKWISDNRSSFAARLVAFAVVEGIFFSSAFASIYWIKKRGLMPGLTFSNELISRDEALHTEFAILLYSKLQLKLSKKRVYDILQEAVDIEKEFITETIPCRMIGMNSKLMIQYIEFIADRLVVQLGYDKIYNSSNPFDFMELISIETKVNFFERTNSEYALADKTIDKDIFELNASF